MDDLKAFVAESNRIEGIHEVRPGEIEAHERFLSLPVVRQADLEAFVSVIQPDAVIRDRVGLNVRVGNYSAPGGGRNILIELDKLLKRANRMLHGTTPHGIHVAYEKLHPFTDGNGRSGRVLWLWMMRQMVGGAPLGFLHHFYYQTLAESR